jgi:hypothetical protein
MRRLRFIVMCLALAASGAEKKKKAPDIEVLEVKVHRIEGKLTLDGRVRNTGEKTIQGLILMFDFLAPGKVPLTTQKTSVDEEILEPGKDGTFRAEMVDPVRAVECHLSAAEDKNGRDLRLAKVYKTNIE